MNYNMKNLTTISLLAFAACLLPTVAYAGDGTKNNPYTVAELNAQKDALAASGAAVWVKADLKGLGEDGSKTDNADTEEVVNGKTTTVKHMAALFSDATGTFVAYSYQILGGINMADLTNTKDLLISLTYGTAGHPYGNTAYPQYSTDYEQEVITDAHFSLEEVHGALSVEIKNGLRGYHTPCCYIIPKDIVGGKVSAGYSQKNGAYVNYNYFDGAGETSYATSKNASMILMAYDGTYDLVLTTALYEQTISYGNALNPGTQAGLNSGTTSNRWCFRFVNENGKTGFERNSDDNFSVTLASKDEVYLMVSSLNTKFAGNWTWETDDKKWISWQGKSITDFENHQPSTATLGDANGDGKIDTQDVVAVVNKLTGNATADFQEKAADVNADGVVNVADVVGVVNLILKK